MDSSSPKPVVSKTDGREAMDDCCSTEAGTTLVDATALTTTAFWADFDATENELDGFWRAEIAKRASAELEPDLWAEGVAAQLSAALRRHVASAIELLMGSDEDLKKESLGPHPMLGCEVMPEQLYNDTDDLATECLGPEPMLGCEVLVM